MFPCGRYSHGVQSRREMLLRSAQGFGGVALAALLADRAFAGTGSSPASEALPPRASSPKAKHVIFLYMDGGPSQVDTFDPKPRLTRDDGKPFAMKIEPTQFNNNGNTFGCPFKFENYGESGIPISDLFPHIAKHADKLGVVRTMTSE